MKKINSCKNCGEKKSPSELFSYVDGNNSAITKNSPVLCRACYIKIYNK